MKLSARSLSILASMMATCLRAKLRLFCATGLIAELTYRRWQMIWGSMPGMLDGDHANTSLLFWRKAASSTFSSWLRRGPICTFLSCLLGLKDTSSTSSSSFHPYSGEISGWIPSSWSRFFDFYWRVAIPFPSWSTWPSRTRSTFSFACSTPFRYARYTGRNWAFARHCQVIVDLADTAPKD